MRLFIVESPGKVKTIQSFLPRDFVVKASVGHCFQIERSNNSIDLENNYTPKYVPIEGKSKVIAEIRRLAKDAEEIYLATDADREGAAISWLLAEYAMNKADKKKIKRIIFREITKTAILDAIEHPMTLDDQKDLFNAQQARSILDMLVGFKISPVLWTKVKSGTSAGRVQSIGLKLIVDRQREIDKFVPKEYWTIPAIFQNTNKETLKALYHSETELPNKLIVDKIKSEIDGLTDWYVHSIDKVAKNKSPYPVFNTSSLQQFCSSTFGWDGKYAMSLAQKLYEGGHISYHRTDSLNTSEEAIANVRKLITADFGKQYCPSKAREFKTKNKVAQEAHEGIRPTHLEKTLDQVKSCVSDLEFKMYEAIYCRFLASQMSDAELNSSKVTIKSKSTKHEFTANGQIIKFEGYLKVWKKYSNTKDEDLICVTEKEKMILKENAPEQHFTKPSAPYNTASLVKVLEEEGIGRPSTYANIVDTLLKRSYVDKDGKAFKPTELGGQICDFLVGNFQELMDTKYTARIESQLDEIANGEMVWYESVDGFYKEIKKRIIAARGAEGIKKSEMTDIDCPTCKKHKLVKRTGRFGDFYGCSGFNIKGKNRCAAMFSIGEDNMPVIKVKKEVRYLEGVVCDKCGAKIAIRTSAKTGKEFGGCSNYPKCKNLYNVDGTKMQ